MTVARIARLSSVVALLLAAAWLFLPTPLGGSTTYVSTVGTSMEPGFATGDLAVLRPAEDYGVGDVVAYHSETLDTTVMHRIVRGDAASGFVLQGDNNSWLDEDTPTGDDVLGRLWLRIPQGGTAIETLRSPWVLALVGVAALTVVGSTARTPRRRGAHRGNHPGNRSGIPLPVRARARRIAPAAAVAAVLGAAGSAALLVLPAAQTEARTVQVSQTGHYTYSAAAVPGTTYPTGRVDTGDPIYTGLIDGLTVTLDHTLSAPGLAAAAGTIRLDVSVVTPDGWTALLTRGPTAAVVDGASSTSVVLDPAGAADVLARHYAEVGAAQGGSTLTVTPVVDVTGTVEGRPFSAGALPPLTFTLDATSLRPAGDARTALTVAAQTPVGLERTVARTVAVAGVSVTLGAARLVAGAVLVLALLALAVATWFGRSSTGGAAEQFAARNAARILRVSALTPGVTVVDVADPDALQRVAERLDGLVLHHEGPGGSTFVVQDGDTTYRCVLPRENGAGRPAPVPVPRLAC